MLENLVRPLLPATFRPAPWPSQRKSKADDDFAELTIADGSGQVIVSSDSWSNNSQGTYNDGNRREPPPLRRISQRVRSGSASNIGASLPAAHGNRAHRTLDRIGVDLHASVAEEQRQPIPVIERIVDRGRMRWMIARRAVRRRRRSPMCLLTDAPPTSSSAGARGRNRLAHSSRLRRRLSSCGYRQATRHHHQSRRAMSRGVRQRPLESIPKIPNAGRSGRTA
jgi:hypothetical protein